MNKYNKGFTLIEMIVAMMVLAVITVPILVMFYFGSVQVARQTASTREVSISRETMQLIIDDLKKFASLSTRIETVGDITKLVIVDDNDKTDIKKLIYAYDDNSKVLLRIVDDLQSVVLSEQQLGDRFYKQDEKIKYQSISPVIFTKDNTQNIISVYLRIKTDQEAQVQESKYFYHIEANDRKVLHIKDSGYIKVNAHETLNLRNSSFTLETYFKANSIQDNRCIFNLLSGSTSKIKLYIKSEYLKLDMGDENIEAVNISLRGTEGIWKKVVVIYDNNNKNIKIYITDTSNPSLLRLECTIPYDTSNLFLESRDTEFIDNIYIANEEEDLGKNFLGALYEPRIWTTATNIYKDYSYGYKLDYTKMLTGREDGLAVYIKDDYTKVVKTTDDVSDVIFQIKNAVNNKVMTFSNVEVDEEIWTVTKGDNISELIGY